MNNFPLINLDTSLKSLSEGEITGEVIDAYICSLSFKNFDSVNKRLPFLVESCTHIEANWRKLIPLANKHIWVRDTQSGVLVFHANNDCGCIRTYRLREKPGIKQSNLVSESWVQVKDEDVLYEMLNTPAARAVFSAWVEHKTRATEMPTVMVNGRLKNTSVDKAFILSKGDGCVVCGGRATCYAATTFGSPASAFIIQLPVCNEHLEDAKAHPNIFSFLASLFHLSLDLPELIKRDSVPDELIPIVHSMVADELEAAVGQVDKRSRGWHLWLDLPSGWKWLLRLNSMTDYAYMLFEPGQKTERYRADSAPDHPEVPFFPIHQHSRPGHKKKDEVTPSFLYGHPLFDLKRLKSAGREYGAYDNEII